MNSINVTGAGDAQIDEEIRAELNSRLEDLLSAKDPGLAFEEIFESS